MSEVYLGNGIDRISRERGRQVREEGFSKEDDLHREDILAAAALCYVRTAYDVMVIREADVAPIHPKHWPMGYSEFKPTGDAIKDLSKAGALIAAAIDAILLDRKSDIG